MREKKTLRVGKPQRRFKISATQITEKSLGAHETTENQSQLSRKVCRILNYQPYGSWERQWEDVNKDPEYYSVLLKTGVRTMCYIFLIFQQMSIGSQSIS